ncbi:MAG: hypothetical protein ABIL58_03275 [Pseudomonadota bacterium]
MTHATAQRTLRKPESVKRLKRPCGLNPWNRNHELETAPQALNSGAAAEPGTPRNAGFMASLAYGKGEYAGLADMSESDLQEMVSLEKKFLDG